MRRNVRIKWICSGRQARPTWVDSKQSFPAASVVTGCSQHGTEPKSVRGEHRTESVHGPLRAFAKPVSDLLLLALCLDGVLGAGSFSFVFLAVPCRDFRFVDDVWTLRDSDSELDPDDALPDLASCSSGASCSLLSAPATGSLGFSSPTGGSANVLANPGFLGAVPSAAWPVWCASTGREHNHFRGSYPVWDPRTRHTGHVRVVAMRCMIPKCSTPLDHPVHGRQ